MHTRKTYEFGAFAVDAAAKVLLKDGEPVRLSRKAVETLLVLVENPGRVVPKEELLAAVWPDRVVDEANLTQNIAVVRRTLAVERGQPGHIETFSGRGYRIVGPVVLKEEPPPPSQPAAAPPAPPEPPPPAPDPEPVPEVTAPRPRGQFPVLLLVLVVLGVAAGGWWVLTRKPPAPEELHRVPVVRLAGKEYQPAISRDGSQVAFIWEKAPLEDAGVWVQSQTEGSPRQVSRGPGQHSSPVWSPDGKSLAYLRFTPESCEILIADLAAGTERAVTRLFPTRYGLNNRHLDWSPDGQWLAVDDAATASEPLGIFLIRLATGERRLLTQPESPYTGDADPRFSPDGKSLAFTRVYHRAWQELAVVPVAGGAIQQLTSDGKQVSGHDWTPDGSSVVFGSNRDGDFKLWRIQPFVSNPARGLRTTGIYGDYPLQVSLARQAQTLVYAVLHQDLNIWRLDLKPVAGSTERWKRIIGSPVMDASPQYSPRGDRIVFRSDRSGEEQLWVSDAEGGGAVQVTHGALRPSVGRWSPDGKSLVFNNSKDARVFVAVETPSGGWEVRDTGALGVHPVFSPDGRWVYAGRRTEVHRVPAAGGAPTTIARITALSLGLSFDGRSLYFVREPAATELWGLDIAGGGTAKVLDGLVPYCSSCWAPAPGGIYYLGSKDNSPHQFVYFHELASGRSRVVLEYPEPLLPIGSGPFSLSPDGRYLLCVRVEPSNADIMRVEPFR